MVREIESLADSLIKHNIKPSYQRIKILQHMIDNKNHPTVDEIYKEVIKEIPTLSKTTVYSTLNLFVEADILRGIYIEENEIRYDSDLSNHGHFKCSRCEKIYDFKINIDDFEGGGLENFQINEKCVYFRGLCPQCKKDWQYLKVREVLKMIH